MATASFQDLTKRRIESALSSFGAKRPRQHLTSGSTSHTARKDGAVPTHSGASGAMTAGSIEKFRLWSRDDLLARISTFKIHTWLVQSPQLSPVKCARNGWINVDCSTLKCPQCSARVIAQIPDDLDDDEEEMWVDRISQQLQSSHNGQCPWKGNECDEALYGVPLATSKEAVDDICRHAAGLLEPREQFPVLAHPLSSFQSSLLADLAGRVVGEESGVSKADAESALVLALFGWRPDPEFSKPAVKCELCFRSVGLWLFRNDGGATRTMLNVADEHRSFCYWTHGSNAAAAASTGQPEHTGALAACCIPGWQKVVASILRAKTIGASAEAIGDDSGSNEGTAGTSERSVDGGSVGQPDLLKKLRPFNISAISSAAEAFGIPFSTSMLAEATRKLASILEAENSAGEPISADTATDAAGDNHGESAVLFAEEAHDGYNDDMRWGDDHELAAGDGHMDDAIPEPIDTSGIASLLGGSSLASALEDPAKAHAILEYVKGLLKARNQASVTAAAPDASAQLETGDEPESAVDP